MYLGGSCIQGGRVSREVVCRGGVVCLGGSCAYGGRVPKGEGVVCLEGSYAQGGRVPRGIVCLGVSCAHEGRVPREAVSTRRRVPGTLSGVLCTSTTDRRSLFPVTETRAGSEARGPSEIGPTQGGLVTGVWRLLPSSHPGPGVSGTTLTAPHRRSTNLLKFPCLGGSGPTTSGPA